MSSLPNNNDFLNSDDSVSEPTKKKRRTALEVEMEKYPKYYAINECNRKCLVATNYFLVLYGMDIIEVPESDKHYHKYFDKKCYDRAAPYQKMKKIEAEYNAMIKRHREESELKNNKQNEKPNGNVVVENTVTEVKDIIVVVQKKEPEPVKQNIVLTPVKETILKKDEQASLF